MVQVPPGSSTGQGAGGHSLTRGSDINPRASGGGSGRYLAWSAGPRTPPGTGTSGPDPDWLAGSVAAALPFPSFLPRLETRARRRLKPLLLLTCTHVWHWLFLLSLPSPATRRTAHLVRRLPSLPPSLPTRSPAVSQSNPHPPFRDAHIAGLFSHPPSPSAFRPALRLTSRRYDQLAPVRHGSAGSANFLRLPPQHQTARRGPCLWPAFACHHQPPSPARLSRLWLRLPAVYRDLGPRSRLSVWSPSLLRR